MQERVLFFEDNDVEMQDVSSQSTVRRGLSQHLTGSGGVYDESTSGFRGRYKKLRTRIKCVFV